jgi:hypothetical protein
MMVRPSAPWFAPSCVAAALLAMPASRLAAQTDPRLVAAIHLAQEGQGDSARAITRTLLSQTPGSDALYPQLLVAAAIVAPTSADMQKSLQRVVVEYSSSEWVDDALVRLAQLDYANGNIEGSVQKLERLRGDFPESPLTAQAAVWAARSYFELKKPTAACKWITDGLAKAGTDVEMQNQLSYYNQRCSAAALATDSATRDTIRMGTGASPAPAPAPGKTPTPPKAPAPASSTPAGAFRLQLAATSAAQAPALVARFKARGVTADTVTEGAFVKVRTGHYVTRGEAQAAVADVKKRTGVQPFVVQQGRATP